MHTAEKLKEMQNWDLKRKIQTTVARIIEWYQHYDGKVYVSFSGGKDSTVLLDITRRIYPDVPAVYCDTGLEYPEIREFVKTVQNVIWIKPEINFRKVIEKYGYPVISKDVSQDVGRMQKNGGINHRTGEKTWAYKSLHGLLDCPLANNKKWAYLVDAPFLISNKCCNVMKKYLYTNLRNQQG